MKFRRILFFMIAMAAAGQPVFSFPFQSSLPEASWIELSMNLGLNPFGKYLRPFLKGFECSFYFQNHTGVGFSFISGGEWFFVSLNGIYLADPVDNSFIVIPVKVRFGGLNYYGDFIFSGSLSSGIKGFFPVFQGKNGKPLYADADILATGFFYINRFDNRFIEFFAEGSAGCLVELTD